MKKIISILLAVILLAGTMPMVMAEEIENAEAPVEVAETPAEAPAEVPAEAPAELAEVPAEPAEAPVEAPAEPAAEPTEVPAEPAEAPAEAPVEAPAEPAAEPAEAPAEEPAAQVSFTGSLSVNIPMPVATGAEASLRAVVSDANMGYSIWWEIQDVEKKWQRIEGATGEVYKFTVNKTSGSYPIRCALRAEDGTVLYSSAPVKVKEQEAAPATEPETTNEEPLAGAAPAEEPEAPTEEPEAPAEEPEAPAEEPEAPAEEPEAPAEEPEAPAEEPETPAEEPEAPAEEPEAPAEEPEAPAEAPEAPAEEPEAPAEEPEVPAEEPEAPAEEPEAPAEEPEVPAEEPEAPAEESEAPAEEPETPAEEPEAPAEEPEAPAEEPEAPAEETEEPAEEADVIDTVPAEEEEETINLEEIEEYETPKGLDEEKPAAVYAYEKDEEGNLILDENGNPIVTVVEGDEIPVTYLRNEDGELILDEKGDPIPTQTVPTDAVVSNTLIDALNPDRTIDIYYSWNNETPAIGGEVTFIAVLIGYDNLEYTIQWQQSKNNADWLDVPGSNETRHSEIVTRDNYKDFWRVQVTITDVIE